MLARILLVLIATSSVAFLLYFEVMLLRESRRAPTQVLTMNLMERVSSNRPRVLHFHKLEANPQQHSVGLKPS
jgi:hypothetical protein